jgi:hypothetical protein
MADRSAIDVEQPPSATVDARSAPAASSLIVRSIPIGRKSPLPVACRWYEPCTNNVQRQIVAPIPLQSFKPFWLETIKA